jgi:phosphoenolpyruvate-protein kinase (PTS system EI component)
MAREPDPDEGVELSEDQYERLQILAGHDKLGSDKSFEQTIQSLIKTAEWNSLSKYGRQELVQKIHAFFKRAARIKLLEGDKDLQRKVQQKLDERLLKQLK